MGDKAGFIQPIKMPQFRISFHFVTLAESFRPLTIRNDESTNDTSIETTTRRCEFFRCRNGYLGRLHRYCRGCDAMERC